MRPPFEVKPQALIFDLDGVILDSMAAHVAAWLSAFAENGLEATSDFIYLNEGALDRERLVRLISSDGGIPDAELFDRLLERQRQIFREHYFSTVRLFPQAAEMIGRLHHAAVPLALVTSSTLQVIRPDLLAWLENHFAVIITGDKVVKSKPDPEPYLAALGGLAVSPGQAVAVENAPAGITSARRAGLICLAVATTLPPEALAEASLVLPDHAALTRLLTDLFQV